MPLPIESLEPRRLFADQAYTPIWSPHLVESAASNDNRARAQPLAKSYDGVTRLAGRVAGGKDKDFYRFDAVYSGRVTVSLSQTGSGVAGVSVYDSAGRELAKQTTGKTTFDARANRSYVLRVARVEGTKPTYQFSLKQTGLDVPEARVDRISRGVNLSSWFWNQSPYTDDPFEIFYNYITERDAQMIRDAGFRNVRLPVDVKFMVNWKKPSKLKSDAVQALDAAIEMLTRNGLAVIVSPFGDYNDKITTADGVPDVLAFAHSWAKHLSRFDPDDVILQTANEPLGDTTSWLPVQWQIATVMRQAAPRHTLLTSATLRYSPDPSHYGSLDALVAGGPLPDPNVIYGFHYYDPYIFTAQGLEWAWPGYGSLRYVPYPSNTENVQWLIDTLDGEIVEEDRRDVLNTLRQYGLEAWNAETIKADLMRVRQWADRYGVPVVADEFGTVSDSPIDPGDRATWIKDVRATLQKLDIGWTMWDYAGDYELAIEDAQGNRTFRREVLDALGLR